MTNDRAAELLTPFLAKSSLSSTQLDQVSAYLDLLVKWNSRVNLTAIREPEQIITRHFGESFFAARHLFPQPVQRDVIDVGSGAGFPGLPFKIWADAWTAKLDLTLVESNHKKSVFLNEVIRTLGIQGARVLSQRAETARCQADVVSFRAVERFGNTLEIARGLLKPQGHIALLIGRDQAEIAKSALPALRWDSPLAMPLSTNRVLLVGEAS